MINTNKSKTNIKKGTHQSQSNLDSSMDKGFFLLKKNTQRKPYKKK